MLIWGLTALFHDAGYPFELAFNNISQYTKTLYGENLPQLTYAKINEFISLNQEQKICIKQALKCEDCYVEDIHTVLSYYISQKLSFSYETVLKQFNNTVSQDSEYIDHGYFSAILLFKKLINNKQQNVDIEMSIDVCMAILLHAAFFRYGIGKGANLSAENHPLSFLLMFCDELQDFDRVPYGRLSKSEPLARNCYIDFINDKISFEYAFSDEALEIDIQDEKHYILKRRDKIIKELNKVLDFKGIEEIIIQVAISNTYNVPVLHQSASFYKNILSIAKQIHRNYLDSDYYNKIDEIWNELPLEIRMSNILQAKGYAEKLDMLGYFYDERELSFQKITFLNDEQIDMLAPYEHKRWCEEKIQMGWSYADYNSSNSELRKKMRAERKHNCLIEYEGLSPNDQGKDKDVIKRMIPNLIDKSIGLNVYKAGTKKQVQKLHHIGITGHRNLEKANIDEIKAKIKNELIKQLAKTHCKICLICVCADGFDMLVAQIAMDLNLLIKVVVPIDTESHIQEIKDRRMYEKIMSYSKTTIAKIPPIDKNSDINLSTYIALNANTILAGWDRKGDKRLGGTYFIIEKAKQHGKHIIIIDVQR